MLSARVPYVAPSSYRNWSGLACAASSSAVSNAVMSGDVSKMPAITISMARSAVFSRGSASAGAIWLIDSSPENASHELPKPTRIGQGLSALTAENCCQHQVPAARRRGARPTTTSTTRFTTSEPTASTAVSTADSRMPT